MVGGHHGTGHQYSPFQTGKGDRFAVDRVDYHERSEVLRFSSVEDWFKGVDLAPKEKVPAEPGNEMKFPACKAAVWFSLFYGFPPFPCFMVFLLSLALWFSIERSSVLSSYISPLATPSQILYNFGISKNLAIGISIALSKEAPS